MNEESKSKAAEQDPTGHYGPGYGDPVEHLGEKPPSGEASRAPAETGTPLTPGAAMPPQPVPGGEGTGAADAGDEATLRSEDVTSVPPDRVPDAPASENAGLIFERS
jgi:hypothetical protein